MTEQMIELPLAGLVLLCIVASLGAVSIVAWIIWAAVNDNWDYALQRVPMNRPQLIGKALLYQVIAVAEQHQEAYRQMYPLDPLFGEFVERVLNNPAYARYHDALRADLRRQSAQYAGKALFVRVGAMP